MSPFLLVLVLAAPMADAQDPEAKHGLPWWRSSPNMAAALSMLVPGAGEAYTGDWETGAIQLGGVGGLSLAAANFPGQQDYEDEVSRAGEAVEEQNNGAIFVNPATTATVEFYLYQIYAAHRDARQRTGNRGYQMPVSDEGIWDLVRAPYSPRIVGRWGFWRDFLGFMAVDLSLAVVVSQFDHEDADELAPLPYDPHGRSAFEINGRRFDYPQGVILAETAFVAENTSVAIGEETFFRGYLQAEGEHQIGTTVGWIVASALFGSLHYPNGDTRLSRAYSAASATAFGLWMGHKMQKNDYRLADNVAAHAWWNVIVQTAGFFAEGPGRGRIDLEFGVPF